VKLLVVEDESKVAKALEEGLEAEHYTVEVARSAEDGFFLASSELFDVVILDLMLPGRDGLEILRSREDQDGSLEPAWTWTW
jgi:two-component system copper resistance phosphate regulon response regulator CusR